MQKLFQLFDEIGLPYFRQGSLTDEEYAPSFFTFWNYDSPAIKYRDNSEKSFSEIVQVCFYTSDANIIYSQMDDFITRARAAGFKCGRAVDTNADKANYYGRLVNIKIINEGV